MPQDIESLILRFLLISLLLTPCIYLGIAVGLILSQPVPKPLPAQNGLDFSGLLARETAEAPTPSVVALRDGTVLPLRSYGEPGRGPLVVALHGSGWHGLQFDGLGKALAPIAHVVAPDLRGHGAAPQRRGDLDYIGQFEDDIADLIAALRQGNQPVVLLGHSSGGGLVVRYAGGTYGADLDGAVLLAPFLKYDAPTTRPQSGGWAQPLTRRLIGLSMLNQVGLRVLNHLTVITFAMPPEVLDGPMGHTATTAYSYRLNTSYAPRADYLADAARLPPFLVLAGREDEAFVAQGYEPLLSEVTQRGTYAVIAETGHLDLPDAPAAVTQIRAFLTNLPINQ